MGHDELERFSAVKRKIEADRLDSIKRGKRPMVETVETVPEEENEASLEEGLQLRVPLMSHQRMALAWMMQREKSGTWCSGGILADDQGLGKTISTLALVVKQGPRRTDDRHTDGQEDRSGKLYGGTLIICPATVLRQWESEIKTKVSKVGLSVIIYHGNKRKSVKTNELASYDIVLTTYGIVGMEVPQMRSHPVRNDIGAVDDRCYGTQLDRLRKAFKKNKVQGPLAIIEWHRVILDEAQCIKNAYTQAALSCTDLNAVHRWCLSGTPIQNSITDLYSYFRFLQLHPVDTYAGFMRNIMDTVDVQYLKLLLEEVMLRRTKSTVLNDKPIVDLPPRLVSVMKIQLSETERIFYNAIQNNYIQEITNLATKKMMGQCYDSVLVMMLRLRQACTHRLLLDSNIDDVDDEDQVDEEERSEQQIKKKKPTDAARKKKEILREKAQHCESSSKLNAVLEVLANMPSGEKALVFSQWTSVLTLVEPKLRDAGFAFLRLDGSMSVPIREGVIRDFKNTNTSILLVSLKAASLGLNLVNANHVILMDAWWNPSTEEQAIDRAHRIGQTRPVHVTRLTVTDTVDDRLLELQQKKRNIVSEIIDKGIHDKTQQKLSPEDIMFLITGQRPRRSHY